MNGFLQARHKVCLIVLFVLLLFAFLFWSLTQSDK